jgi:hypothetical protein
MYGIREALLQEIHEYLRKRPHCEVEKWINEIRQCEPIKPEESKQE